MNGAEFIRRVRRYARKTGKEYSFDPSQGKGSHGLIYLGGRLTTVPRKEIGSGLLGSMLKDLDIPKEEF